MVQQAAQKALARAQPPQAHVSPEQAQEHAVRAAQKASRRRVQVPLALQ